MSFIINDKRGIVEPTEVCRVCGSLTIHSKKYNNPTMECISFLRKRISELENNENIKFDIFDNNRKGAKISRPQDYYINGNGDIFYDCDPTGVDMSGKRRILGVDNKRFTTKLYKKEL